MKHSKHHRSSLDAEMSLRDSMRRRFLIETGVLTAGVAASAWLDATGKRVRASPTKLDKLA
jgi:hypothetical protein